jgi:hypothetical protein
LNALRKPIKRGLSCGIFPARGLLEVLPHCRSKNVAQSLWAMIQILWKKEWLKVLWFKVTFLVGRKIIEERAIIKERVIRKRGERCYPTCI